MMEPLRTLPWPVAFVVVTVTFLILFLSIFHREILRKLFGTETWLGWTCKDPNVWFGLVALVAFLAVIWQFPEQSKSDPKFPFSKTLFAIAMGALGSSVYLLNRSILPAAAQAKDDHVSNHPFVRLGLGPIAGWLAQNMVQSQSTQPISIWLPFLAGFSSDLLVGIINQMIRAIKITLGIEREHQGPPERDDIV